MPSLTTVNVAICGSCEINLRRYYNLVPIQAMLHAINVSNSQ